MTEKNTIAIKVAEIIETVRKNGDRALELFGKKFDKVTLRAREFSISQEKMKISFDRIPNQIRSALIIAQKRIERFHREELKRIKKSWSVNIDGIEVGQKLSPISSIGAYVPGGRFSYPSTVLMTCIPARVAGVKQIVIVTPPKGINDEILAAAYLSKVDQCFTVGGPAAISALAFGTETIPKVEKIVGPGNQYVTEAKRQLFGQVGIDGLAGPSEIVVWADSSAKLSKVLVNLMAQAEHDPESKSVLISKEIKVLNYIRKNIPQPFLKQTKFVLKKSERQIIDSINEIAPEHLYLAISNPQKVLPRIENAGAIFLGEDTPVPLGDYVAGPSHVLPTGRTAKFSSGLSVKDFLKSSSVIRNKSKNAYKIFDAAKQIAEIEGLRYHALSLIL